VGLRADLDRCGKSRRPSGFDPRTVQLVGSRYTDRATRPTFISCNLCIPNKRLYQIPSIGGSVFVCGQTRVSAPDEPLVVARFCERTKK